MAKIVAHKRILLAQANPAARSCIGSSLAFIVACAMQYPASGVGAFDTVLDVTESMGGRFNPNASVHDGADLLAVDLNNMHLLNEVTGVVL